MARITVIDSQTAGISGDMLLAALIDAGADQQAIQHVLERIPTHYPKCKSLRLEAREVKMHGFRACGVRLNIIEDAGETKAEELLHAAEKMAIASGMSKKASSFTIGAIKMLVETESKLHGVDLASAHLHEAGSTDTLADTLGVAVACDNLGIFDGDVYSTPVAVGGGTAIFSHGELSTPVPAVLEILEQRKIPIRGGPERVELATPTGVALLANLAGRAAETYPAMVLEKVGYGAGTRELSSSPNILRVAIGRNLESRSAFETIQILETNLDDLPGEILGHTLQRVLDSGAKDAWITSAQFKKNRPGHVLHVLCDMNDLPKLVDVIMQETGTLGVRYQQWDRFAWPREVKTVKLTIEGKSFDVRVKSAKDAGGKVFRVKPEFDDILAIAETLSRPVREISEIVMSETKRIREDQRSQSSFGVSKGHDSAKNASSA